MSKALVFGESGTSPTLVKNTTRTPHAKREEEEDDDVDDDDDDDDEEEERLVGF